MPAFDTSALLPLFIPGHADGQRARALFDDAAAVLLHPCVLTELTQVLRREVKAAGQDGNRVAREALQALLDQPRLTIQADVPMADATLRYLSDSKLSLTDAIVAEMRWHFDRQEPISFDARVVKASRESPAQVRARLAKTAKAP